MLFSPKLIAAVADYLATDRCRSSSTPSWSRAGARLLQDDAVETLVDRLFGLATVVTPNLLEAEALVGRRIAP